MQSEYTICCLGTARGRLDTTMLYGHDNWLSVRCNVLSGGYNALSGHCNWPPETASDCPNIRMWMYSDDVMYVE